VDAFSAGRLTRTLDSLHSVSYFVPEANEKFRVLGMQGRTPYFAARSAPMGAVGAGVVAATFYNFSPELIAASIPAAWEMASPQTVTEMRYAIVEEALPRVLGPSLTDSAELARAADVVRGLAEAIPNGDGRPLYSAHAQLAWPTSPHARLWHAISLLREHRGDGHIAALTTYGLSGIEALITHTAAGIGFTVEFARGLRGWSEDQWTTASARLRQRRLVDDSGALTSRGLQLRTEIEDLTDRLAFEPWRSLADNDADDLQRFAKAMRQQVVSAGAFPQGAFGPRYGEHR
jgi:hypothetical protein